MKPFKDEKRASEFLNKILKDHKPDFVNIKSSDKVKGTADPQTHIHEYKLKISSSSGDFVVEFLLNLDEGKEMPGVGISHFLFQSNDIIKEEYEQAPSKIEEGTKEVLLNRRDNKKNRSGTIPNTMEGIAGSITYELFRGFSAVIRLRLSGSGLAVDLIPKGKFLKPDKMEQFFIPCGAGDFKSVGDGLRKIINAVDNNFSVKSWIEYRVEDAEGKEIKKENIDDKTDYAVFIRTSE